MTTINDDYEFVRAVFKPGGREYTYIAKPDELAVGEEATNASGKTLHIVAVKTSDAMVNGNPLPIEAYGWLTKKVVAEGVYAGEPTVILESSNGT